MSMKGHVDALERKHADLEHQIAEAEKHPGVDHLEIAVLKKRKLAIKEELEEIRAA